ncbi:hypothetical protein B296_00057583 [Ensete ventricosum]|uniref:Uncharacterized protein n=1 Tax=Ensete ventricosum TaxID=4639 RepID=A0A426WX89_ENSVE|nr:hypothetical protein B296_00057583 [Ensete ventricosum]
MPSYFVVASMVLSVRCTACLLPLRKVGLAPPYLCQVDRMTADPPMLVSGRAQSRRVSHIVGPAVRGRRDVTARSTFIISHGNLCKDIDLWMSRNPIDSVPLHTNLVMDGLPPVYSPHIHCFVSTDGGNRSFAEALLPAPCNNVSCEGIDPIYSLPTLTCTVSGIYTQEDFYEKPSPFFFFFSLFKSVVVYSCCLNWVDAGWNFDEHRIADFKVYEVLPP